MNIQFGQQEEPMVKTFFSRSPIQSPGFIVVIILFVALIIESAMVFKNFLPRMPWSIAMGLLIMLYVGVLGQVIQTIRRHSRIHELYLVGKIPESEPSSSLNIVLEVAERSMIDGLFFFLSAVLAFLLLLAHFFSACPS
jgi:hypothetical protein